MRKILITALILFSSLAFANPPGTFNSLLLNGGYVGPGDLVSGATQWVGLRGYKASFAGAAINICLPLDATCVDVNIVGGSLVLGTISTLGCNNSTAICTIKEWYDQTGNGNHMLQATIANRATLVLSGLGTLPYANFIGSTPQTYNSVGNVPLSQPVSVSAFAYRSSTDGNFNSIWASNTSTTGELSVLFVASVAANALGSNPTISSNVASASATWHAIQGVLNVASSVLRVDSTDTTGLTLANSSGSNTITMGTNGGGANPLTGRLTEVGTWSLAFTLAQRANLEANQCTYWGIAC